jgi:hypothetical protein
VKIRGKAFRHLNVSVRVWMEGSFTRHRLHEVATHSAHSSTAHLRDL